MHIGSRKTQPENKPLEHRILPRTQNTMSTVRKCGICREPGHNRRRCQVKEIIGKVFGYTPLVVSILDFLVTDRSYEQLYDLSKVNTSFQKAVHFITRNTVDIKFSENFMFCNRTIKYLQPFTQIRSLNLSYQCVDRPYRYIDSGFKHLSSFTNLSHLDISYNEKLPTNVLFYFKNNKKLQYLKISQCNNDITDSSLSYLENFPDLRYLNVRYCKLTSLSFLQFCPKLETLKLECREETISLDELKFCPNLKSLSIHLIYYGSRYIDSKVISCLRSLERLHVVRASKVDDDDVACLKDLPCLKYLYLDMCDNITDLSSLDNIELIVD